LKFDARIARLRERLKAGDPDLTHDELQVGIDRAEAKRRELMGARASSPENGARRSVEQKARVVADASNLSGEQVMAYLAEQGVQLAEFERWRTALQEEPQRSTGANRRIRQLERELARKEKALAEAAALLVLKKDSAACRRTRTTTSKGRARADPRFFGRGADGRSSISTRM
jgi:hypothetical protein